MNTFTCTMVALFVAAAAATDNVCAPGSTCGLEMDATSLLSVKQNVHKKPNADDEEINVDMTPQVKVHKKRSADDTDPPEEPKSHPHEINLDITVKKPSADDSDHPEPQASKPHSHEISLDNDDENNDDEVQHPFGHFYGRRRKDSSKPKQPTQPKAAQSNPKQTKAAQSSPKQPKAAQAAQSSPTQPKAAQKDPCDDDSVCSDNNSCFRKACQEDHQCRSLAESHHVKISSVTCKMAGDLDLCHDHRVLKACKATCGTCHAVADAAVNGRYGLKDGANELNHAAHHFSGGHVYIPTHFDQAP